MTHEQLKRIEWIAGSLQWLEFMRKNTRKKRVSQRKNFSSPAGRNRAIDTNHTKTLWGEGKKEEKVNKNSMTYGKILNSQK